MEALKASLAAIVKLIPPGAPLVYMDYPVLENVGDLLIMLGTEQFFRDYDLPIAYRASIFDFHRLPHHLRRPDTVILSGGGGNLGDLYNLHQTFRERLIANHAANRIIHLPQSIHFSDRTRLAQCARVMRAHPDLHIFVRDEASHRLAREHFSDNVYLSPDMAHQLWPKFATALGSAEEDGVLHLMRTDGERRAIPATLQDKRDHFLDWPDLLGPLDRLAVRLFVYAHRANGYLGNRMPVHRLWCAYANRLVDRALALYRTHASVVTSRLHGHILACLMAKPNQLIDNSYGKNSAYFRAWTQRIPGCALLEGETEASAVSTGLSVVFCTRNRPAELKRAVDSVLRGLPQIAGMAIEILVMDDGQLEPAYLAGLGQLVTEAGAAFSYVNKRERAGLLRSRVETLEQARHETLLFLDDDVEVETGYLQSLLQTYAAYPFASGVGGVDLLCEPAPRWRQWYEYWVGFRAFRLGRLSASGFGGGMDQWKLQDAPFKTDFLYGCNMSFKKSALADLKCPSWFAGYSLGEDHYLSYTARQHGRLIAQPKMRVRHYQSPVARDKLEQVSYTLIVNHYQMLGVTRASFIRYLSFSVTAGGLLLMFCGKAALDALRLKPDFSKVRGSLRGIRFIIAGVFGGHPSSRLTP